MEEIKIGYYEIDKIQPSQFYISKDKLESVLEWFNAKDLSNFEPVPLKRLNGEVIYTDGHTRAIAAYMNGLKAIPFYWDEDDLDWTAYECCVRACKEQNIVSIRDLINRIVPKEQYEAMWYAWCDELHAALQEERCGL